MAWAALAAAVVAIVILGYKLWGVTIDRDYWLERCNEQTAMLNKLSNPDLLESLDSKNEPKLKGIDVEFSDNP